MRDSFDEDLRHVEEGEPMSALPNLKRKTVPVNRKPKPKPDHASKDDDTELFRMIGADVGREFAKRDARIAALEQRLNDGGFKGVWADGTKYKAGAFVTHSGSLWHCNNDTTYKPGTSSDWTLAVKRGHAQ